MEEVWTTAFFGVIFFAVFGILCGIGLAYAARRFAIKVDPRIEAVRAYLPGAN
jgi:electron transport complex protein RnfB